jgi:hypothetical protein
MLRDIRDQMPRTPQTDPNKFPAYKYHPYPRMMKDERGEPFKTKAGQFVIVNSAEEEAAFRGQFALQPEAKTVEVDAVSSGVGSLNNFVAQVEQNTVKRGPGRPPKLPADLS